MMLMIPSMLPAQANLPLQRDIVLEEANKSLVIGFHQRLHKIKDTETAFKVLDPQYSDVTNGKRRDKKQYMRFCLRYLRANSDHHAEIIHAATEGEWVYLYTRTYSQENIVTRISVDIYRVINGLITEHKEFSKA